MSAALATAVVAGPGAPIAAAQVSGDVSAAVAAESPANRAIEIREGGLPLRVGSQGDLVAHVQRELGVVSDGIFGPQTDAAVRKYQLSAGLDVDGIVGLNTWSSLFEQAGASGASLGGSNVPPQVKQQVEQTLQQAGTELAVNAAPPSATTPTSQPNTTVPNTTAPTTQAPASGSCSSATISTPVKGTVTSPYGPRGGRNHDGMDIAAPSGTPVHAAACGTVSLAGQQSGYGNIVCVTHTSQFSTCYAHLSRFGVSNGAQVQQGQVIGYVGCTGSCTGPHLHFETRVNGQAQNPSTYLSGGSTIPGKRATVAGTSNSGTTATATTATATTQPASGESVQVAPTAQTATTEAAPVPAEAAPTAAVGTEVAVPAEVATQPVVATQVAPTEVADLARAVAVRRRAAGYRPRLRRSPSPWRHRSRRLRSRHPSRSRPSRSRSRRRWPLRQRLRPSPSPPRPRWPRPPRMPAWSRLRQTWPLLPPCSRARSRKVAAGPVGRRSQGGTVEAPLVQGGVFAFRGRAGRAARYSYV